MNSALNRLRTEWRDLLELVLLPGLAAVLPWPLCFRIFRRLARWDWLYHDPCHSALTQARLRGWVHDEANWLLKRRLITLVDHADFYLARTRSDAWMRRYVHAGGRWPTGKDAAILCTFHWGAGMWGLRHAAAHGLHAHALVAAMEGMPFAGRSVLRRYAMARTRSVGRALGRAPLVVSGSLRPVVQALRRNEQVFAAVDVPADQVDASVPVVLRGMCARVPKGLLRLAADMRVPVTVYVTGFDVHTGQRLLDIVQMPLPSADGGVQELADAVFQHLEASLARDNAFWHFWGEAPRFFTS